MLLTVAAEKERGVVPSFLMATDCPDQMTHTVEKMEFVGRCTKFDRHNTRFICDRNYGKCATLFLSTF